MTLLEWSPLHVRLKLMWLMKPPHNQKWAFSPWLCELTRAQEDLSKEQQADTTKERSIPHRYPVKSFLSHTAKQYPPFGTFTYTCVTWQARWLQDETPACDHQASAARIPPLLPQPISICSSNLTCLLTHRRLCWIEERNYGASSPCWLLGWGHSALHCQNKLMSQLVPVPSEIWQRARTTIRGLWLVK